MANFNLSHKDPKPEPDLFSWADDARTPAKTPKVQAKWELDVKGLISSKRWLKLHGLKRNQLQLNQILARIGFKHSDSKPSYMMNCELINRLLGITSHLCVNVDISYV